MEFLQIKKYKSLLDQKNQELKDLKSKYEKADKERLAIREDFIKVSSFIQNTQQLLDEQDEITKSVNTQIAETQNENIELKREKQKLQSELELKENESREFKEMIKERDERIKLLENELKSNYFLLVQLFSCKSKFYL